MKKLDSIALTSIAAQEAGMSYGKYVAMFGVVTDKEEETDSLVAPKVCQECGRTFYGRAKNMKFCSEECRMRSDNRKFGRIYRQRRAEKAKNRVCAVCGEAIPESRALNAKTCSEECSEEFHRINKNRRRMKKRETKEVNKDT